MTGHELLQATLPDILFENRNKMYGAYTLRKGYNNRLVTAVLISVTTMFSLSFVIASVKKEPVPGINWAQRDSVQITTVEIKKKDPVVQKEITQPKSAIKWATKQFTTIDIVPDITDPNTEVPANNALSAVHIGTITVDGTPGDDTPVMPAAHGTGTGADKAAAEVPADFSPLQVQPQFPGGAGAWAAFLNRYLRTPDELENGERRTVLIRFSVGNNGSIADFQIIQSGGASFDNEVIRVLKKMPAWKPAMQNGHPVAVTFTQPVTFQAVEQ